MTEQDTITISESELEQLVEQKVQERAAAVADQQGVSRRKVLASLAGVAGAGALGYTGGRRVAADPSDAAGTVYFEQIGDSSNPVEELHVGTEFVDQTSLSVDDLDAEIVEATGKQNKLILDEDPDDDQDWRLSETGTGNLNVLADAVFQRSFLTLDRSNQEVSVGGGATDIDVAMNGNNLTGAGSVSTETIDTTDETFVRPDRSTDSSSLSAENFTNAYDGETADVRNEFNSSTQFVPDRNGYYVVKATFQIGGNTSAGDSVIANFQNPGTAVLDETGFSVVLNSKLSGNPALLSVLLEGDCTAGESYEVRVANMDSSFVIEQANTYGRISRLEDAP